MDTDQLGWNIALCASISMTLTKEQQDMLLLIFKGINIPGEHLEKFMELKIAIKDAKIE